MLPHRCPAARAKSKPRLASDVYTDKVSICQESMEDTRELPNTINSFPTVNQPISESTLKDMLISLRSSLHADMMECMKGFKTDVHELGDRVDHVEQKMGEYAASYNSLVDAHNDQSDEVTWLKAKVVDLEDRWRRKNLKLRGVPESTLSVHLQQSAQDLMKAFLPELSESDLIINRIHRLSKPKHLPDNIPRDVLMRVHFFHVKEGFMLAFRKNRQPPEKYSSVQLFPDLSQFTMQRCKSLLSITKALRNHNIAYRWEYPLTLTITRDDNTSVIYTLEEGLKLLRAWDIFPEETNGDSPSNHIQAGDPEDLASSLIQKK